MSKPITNAAASPLPFEQRLELVKAEIVARVASHPANTHSAVRARLWVKWIKANLLDEPKQPRKPFNCDLYPHRTRNEAVEVVA